MSKRIDKALAAYLMPHGARALVARVSQRVAELATAPAMKTEVIREGGWVHGRTIPIPK